MTAIDKINILTLVDMVGESIQSDDPTSAKKRAEMLLVGLNRIIDANTNVSANINAKFPKEK